MAVWFSRDKFKPLKKLLGPERCRSAPEDLLLYSGDATQMSSTPEVVVFPENAEEAAQVIRFARTQRMAVTPRGAGSGLSGGSIPVHGGIVLSCERMNRVVSLDKASGRVRVEPGVVTSVLQTIANRSGWFYPPDPSSWTVSTIGGNVAENAGGLRCFKYGVTGNYVLGVEFLNAEGERVRTGTLAPVTGAPDLTGLLVGSEGTLGLITLVELALLPVPETTTTLAAWFPEEESALETVGLTVAGGWMPSILEFIGGVALAASSAFAGVVPPEGAGAMVLIELDGVAAEVALSRQTLMDLLTKKAMQVLVAESASEREKLWNLRRAVAPSLIRRNTGKIHEDIAVPRGRLAVVAQRVRQISEKFKVEPAVYGHAGDGNLHVVFLYDAKDQDATTRARQAQAAVFEAALEMGGTITGEHGVGCAKQGFMRRQFSPTHLEVFRRVKNLMDPNGIFNPGKVLPVN